MLVCHYAIVDSYCDGEDVDEVDGHERKIYTIKDILLMRESSFAPLFQAQLFFYVLVGIMQSLLWSVRCLSLFEKNLYY